MARILVADDDGEVRGMIREMLERAGHEVIEASNGVELTRLFYQNPTDVVVTDIIMPEKEGLSTILELKRFIPDVKIVAISGGGIAPPRNYVDWAIACGADKGFIKPFERQEFLDAVEELIAS